MIDTEKLPALLKIVSDCESMISLLVGCKIKIKIEEGEKFISKRDALKMQLQNQITAQTGLSWMDIAGKRRNSEFVDARRIYAILAYHYLDFTLNCIGDDIGKRDHTTVINLLRVPFKKIPILKPIINKISKDLKYEYRG